MASLEGASDEQIELTTDTEKSLKEAQLSENELLTANELASLAKTKKPYFKVWAWDNTDRQDEITHVSTNNQELMYDPRTYSGSWKSNLAVVMKIKNVGRGQEPRYIISNIVIPNTYLKVTEDGLRTRPQSRFPVHKVLLENYSNANGVQRFKVAASGSNQKWLQFYRETRDGKKSILYPTVSEDNHKIIAAAETDRLPFQAYRFFVSYIPNFDLKGYWVSDEESPAFEEDDSVDKGPAEGDQKTEVNQGHVEETK